ncbi:MAG: hypothetical protein IPN67_19305 [Bacteroidales bacterium]|nr:hypothetical protein [Bacteroidales bacterium]
MKELSIYAVVIITLVIMIRYILLLVRKEIKPALAMWLFFSIAIIMSLITYRSEGGYGLLDNIMNTVDLVYVVTVCVAIFLFGDKSSKFTRFDRGCLIAVLLILFFWIFTQNHRITNILMQAILVIAYFPVVKRLVESKENTEPFSVWIGMLLAPSLALLSSKGTLATVYSVRAIICVSILLLLMLRIEILKMKNNLKLSR